MKLSFPGFNSSKREIGFLALLFCFSVWIMFRTFSYDDESSTILIFRMMWSDFAATLPLIRSFSLGENWPPEYPIFPGSPIQYHYLFFLIVGYLEKLGVPIHWALNVPSIAGFFLILLMIYLLARKWFGDARVGVLAVAFFLLNGSMSFLQFFQNHPLSLGTLGDIAANQKFSAMGPWDGGNVLGVWHLLVFVSQRHLSVAFGILFSFIYVCNHIEGKSRKVQLYWALFFGLLIGLFPLFHKAVLLIFAIVMSVYFVGFPPLRRFLFATGAVSVLVMGLLWLMSFDIFGGSDGFSWHPGFTTHKKLSLANGVLFFWYQFGLHCILIPIGLVLAPKRVRIFVLPAFIVLVIAFLFRFSRTEVLIGHKFFNFFLMLAQTLTAFAIVKTYDLVSKRHRHGRTLALGISSVLVLFLTLSGVIDLSAIANIPRSEVRDLGSDPKARWYAENTPKNAVVLASKYLYAAPSLAGRKSFMGWRYFTDGAGYDTAGRLKVVEQILSGEDRAEMCRLLHENDIGYVEVAKYEESKYRPPVNREYFNANFTPEYVSGDASFAIYATTTLCE